MRKCLLTLGASLLATLLMSGAAQAGSEKEANGAVDDDVVVVDMVNMEFLPAELEIPPGTTVRWVNATSRSFHDVYFPDEDIGSPLRMLPDESWERTFDEPGTYEYICRPHEQRGMVGVVRVVEASDDE